MDANKPTSQRTVVFAVLLFWAIIGLAWAYFEYHAGGL
jgi:hypothetical protein